jgi:hypothetical protein
MYVAPDADRHLGLLDALSPATRRYFGCASVKDWFASDVVFVLWQECRLVLDADARAGGKEATTRGAYSASLLPRR